MKKYFFCYDEELSEFLSLEKHIRYITVAINPKTGCKFWLYEQTPSLSEAIKQSKAIKQ